MDLVSALDYLGDIDTYLHECDKESIPCDIKYLKDRLSWLWWWKCINTNF